MASAAVHTFTDANFQSDALEAGMPVVVDFWAEWCGPCKAIAPIIDEVADEYAGRVRIGKLDTDSNQQVAIQYGIMSIPTVMFFKDGQLVDKMVGLGGNPKQQLVDRIEKMLG